MYFNERNERKKPKCKKGQTELIGLILFIIGIMTLCAFILPLKLWLFLLGGTMIFCGYKLFVSN